MKKFGIWFGIIVILFIIETSIGNWFPLTLKPDLVLVGLIYFALRRGPVTGVFLGFLIGLLQDIYTIEHLGANALSKLMVAYLVGLFDEQRFTHTPVTKLLFLAGAILFHDIIYNLVWGLSFASSMLQILQVSLLQGFITLIVATPIFYYFNWSSRDVQ